MKLGIIGLGQSGKTTIFNALTNHRSEENNAGNKIVAALETVSVPDERVDRLGAIYQPKKLTYAQMVYMDLQGTVGVSDNKQDYMSLLLTHIRPMNALLLVVRNFTHPMLGAPHADKDLQELEDEFLIADLGTVERRLEKIELEKKRGKKVSEKELAFLHQCGQLLNEGKPLRDYPALMDDPDFRGFTFLSAKPLLAVINNDDSDTELPKLSSGHSPIVVRGKLEMEMAQLPAEESAEFLSDYGIEESAMARVIHFSYKMLNLQSFLTVGEDEVRSWTIRKGTLAKEAAGAIHSDIEKGFIRAEVVHYNDLIKAGDFAKAKRDGLVRLETKTYPFLDGDVVNFRFNV